MKNVALFLFLIVAAGLTDAQSATPGLASQAQSRISVIRGTLKVSGLHQPVNVLRDKWGVAHLYAQNQHDLFFAQGFVAAQDRLFQMELWKRSGQGRLAEVLGSSALPRDVNARLLRYRGDMQSEYASYSPDTQEILQAFTTGINSYIASRTVPGGPGLPIEFDIAGFAPEAWKPEDCLNRMAAFAMTGNAFYELEHAQAVASIGPEKASQLFDFDPPVTLDPAPNVDLSGLSAKLLRNLVGSDTRIEFPTHALEGSNNWTISGSLTSSGKPLLANDPHRVIAEPSLRYIVHLVAPGWDVIGAGEPALPGVALGHNQNIAWGFTVFGLDQQDLYLEELNPKDPLQYRTERGWEKMLVRKETVRVRGGAPVTVDLKFTGHGPVLWEDGKRALALRWVGAEPGAAGYLGSLALDRARNWRDFEAAMPRWKVPSENIVYADREGNIGEHSVGLAPLRKNWTGLLPVPGVGAFDWTGFVPTEELPHQFNPAAGFVVSANHKMIPDGYPYKVGYLWAPPYRFRRITEVLEQAKSSRHKLTLEDMQRLQNDVDSLPARDLLELLRHVAAANPDSSADLLLHWDHVLNQNSAAAALYELWLSELSSAVMHRSIPKSLWGAIEWSTPMVVRYLQHPSEQVFGPSPEASRNQVLRESLKTATEQLAKLQGRDPEKWSWGALHAARFQHPLDRTPGGAELTDLGPVPRGGDEYTVNATGFDDGSYDQVSGASYREIIDVSDWDRSLTINVPGQSGQPGSPHYADLLPLWSQGKYFPLLYSREAIEKETTDKLVLEP